MYPALRSKLERIFIEEPSDLNDFKDDITKLSRTALTRLRFYSLGDFSGTSDILYIKAAADIMPVELFSKVLHAFDRDSLLRIASIDNVNISLSLNRTWSDDYIKGLYKFLLENKLLDRVQLNYCFMGDEDLRLVPHVSVYHTTKRNKLGLFKFFGYNRVCCGRDKDGIRVTAKNSGNAKGSCAKCPLCKLPAADANGDLLTPRKLQDEYERYEWNMQNG